MKVDPAKIHRLFYPQVPMILGARSGRRVSAMPVISYASISVSPPLIVVACEPTSYTLKLALTSKAFSLCLVNRGRIRAVALLAERSGKDVADKLADAGLSYETGKTLDVPVVKKSEATLECRLRSEYRFGDHVMLVGLVKDCYASDKFHDFWDFERYDPILYTGWREGMTTYEDN